MLSQRITTSRAIVVASLCCAALLSGCADSDTPADPTAAQPSPASSAVQPPDAVWYTDDERAELDRDGIEWLAALFVPEALEDVLLSDLEPRWWPAKASDYANEFERAVAAFALLQDSGPDDLVNPLQGVSMQLLGMRREGTTVILDFAEGITASAQMDAATAQAAQVQLRGTVLEYFPDATALALTVDRQKGALLFGGENWDSPRPLAS